MASKVRAAVAAVVMWRVLAPAGGGGVIGAQGLNPQHDLGFVTRMQGGQRAQHAAHPPVGLAAGFVGVERQVAHDGANGFVDDAWVEGAVIVEDGVAVVGWGFGGVVGHGAKVRIMFLIRVEMGMVKTRARGGVKICFGRVRNHRPIRRS
jgi:hypothetical protein